MRVLPHLFISRRRLLSNALRLSLLFFLSYSLYCIGSMFHNEVAKVNPSDWPVSVLLQNGVYELKLNYITGITDTHVFIIPESSVKLHGRPFVLLSQQDLEGINDRHWLLPVDPIVYFAYPQAIDLGNTVSRLLSFKPIILPPINGDTYRFVSIPKSVCFPGNDATHEFDVVVIIKTMVSSFKRRNTFRRIYGGIQNADNGGLRIGHIFSMGMPRSKADNIFQRGGRSFKLRGRSGDTLNLKALNRTGNLLELEIETYDDLLIGAFEDTYFNLTRKSHQSFLWASTFCRKSRPDILFIDDDVPYSPEALEKALSSMPSIQRRNLFHGKLVVNSRVVRFGSNKDQRWALTKSEAPWPIFAPYHLGLYCLVGFNQTERVALGMMFTKYFSVDDAWIGLVATRLNIKLGNINDFIKIEDMLIKNRRDFEPVDPAIFWVTQ
ncbi:hypothetical protein Aperf_G00000054335 [Anoplocephala perfoliata]